MAEQFQRSKLYEYGANSNLVLEADRSEGGSRRREEDGAGEVESLYGKLNTVRMGEYVNRDRRVELTERLEKIKSKRERMEEDETNLIKSASTNKKKKDGSSTGISGSNIFLSSKTSGGGSGRGGLAEMGNSSFLSVADDLDTISYRPKTRESRLAYEEILSLIQVSLGDQPQDILRGAAEEVLGLLKDVTMRDPEKIKEITKLLPKISIDRMNKLFNLGKRITDFQLTGGAGGGINGEEEEVNKMDEEMGVAVVFDDADDDENAAGR